MFETLQDRLGSAFKMLTGRGVLSEKDVSQALREIRKAFLEADVALEVVRSFTEEIREKLVGIELLNSIKPGQMVVKLVYDELLKLMGSEQIPFNFNAAPPVVFLMVGLQGAGKTTTTAKLAKQFSERKNKKVLMASLDVYRPAAQEQLDQLGRQSGIATLPIIQEQQPLEIAKRALQAVKLGGYDVLILDTSGRTHVDEELMQEISNIEAICQPQETLLVCDSLIGQDSVKIASSFQKAVRLTGVVFTRMDSDGRGGAVLSIRSVTGLPIKAISTGEKLEDLEEFHPRRAVDRILGMGDIVSLVEKTSEGLDAEKAKQLAKKIKKGHFDLNDFSDQIKQMKKLGGIAGIMSFLPGIGKAQSQLASAGLNDKVFTRQVAIIQSMTKQERTNPEILKHSRKQRIAKGAGVTAADINKLLKMHRQMADMMKTVGKQKNAFEFPSIGNNVEKVSPNILTKDLLDFQKIQNRPFPLFPKKPK